VGVKNARIKKIVEKGIISDYIIVVRGLKCLIMEVLEFKK